MACTTTLTGFATSCGSNLPSIKKLFIGSFESCTFEYSYQQDGEGQDIIDADGNKIIEAVTDATLAVGADNWVEFQFRKNTSEMTSELTVNDNGSHYYTNSANLVFAKIDNTKRLALQATASGECTMIILDSNNQYWLIGAENAVTMSTMSATTGVAVGDSNSYNVTLSSDEATMPILLSPANAESIINTLLGAES